VVTVASTPPQPVTSRTTTIRPARRVGRTLDQLFGPTTGEAVVSGITLDSRLVAPGDLYVALPGARHHGAEFAPAAVAAGAVAILTDPAGRAVAGSVGVPVVGRDDPRAAMASLAAEIYGRPAEAMTMFAVTGTNGKTTTTYLLEAALLALGHHTGLVGTLGYRLDGAVLPAARTTVTTPESPELQALLGYLREQGADAVLMEVSSHALVLGRADAITFDVSAFTNFGRDHLDFHGDEESYFAAKASLFTTERSRRAVVNIDDVRGRQLVHQLATTGAPTVRTVSLSGPADYRATAVHVGDDGRTAVVADLAGRVVEFGLSLPGDFNVRNALTALAMVDMAYGNLSDTELARAATGLGRATIPGRMERVDLGPGAPLVYVDFAHTPQAVAAALTATGERRRIVVLGCGGDRDRQKRRPMGAAAAAGADVVVVTDDNPRSEDPAVIRAEILAGAAEAVRVGGLSTTVLDGGDRRSAIRKALELAGAGDVVAILGKGHEDGQELAGQVLRFSDADTARDQWRRHSRVAPG
jgi:UDP-N-acetylmuramoyl-L-alanyl-D-glutamate--2,6-diaminopimelate ligase